MGSHVAPLSSQLYSLEYLSSLDLFPDLNDEECTSLLPGRGVRLVKCMTQ